MILCGNNDRHAIENRSKQRSYQAGDHGEGLYFMTFIIQPGLPDGCQAEGLARVESERAGLFDSCWSMPALVDEAGRNQTATSPEGAPVTAGTREGLSMRFGSLLSPFFIVSVRRDEAFPHPADLRYVG